MKLKKEIFIFHFSPLEIYPPILNFSDYLSKNNNKNIKITIITTFPNDTLSAISYPNIKIIRYKGIDPKASSLHKIGRYLHIYAATFFMLCRVRPKVVFYFETLSSLPILLYKELFKKTNVYVHYHEIYTIKDLQKGRILNKLLNKMEISFYPKATWISHTNVQRLTIFKQQYSLNEENLALNVLPNYPPKYWATKEIHGCFIPSGKLRIVHIGSLSWHGMYLKETLDFFGNKHDVQIDFFSHLVSDQILEEFKKYKNVHYIGSIEYTKIPTLKGQYDLGLVLYKGNCVNFTFNAPNKIFEYLALDLDVWCSDKLITAREYANDSTFPKMIMVDYENLEFFDWKSALNRKGLSYKRSPYFHEKVYKFLWVRIMNSING